MPTRIWVLRDWRQRDAQDHADQSEMFIAGHGAQHAARLALMGF